jgi:phosphotransferase system enzyme I (PtsP)
LRKIVATCQAKHKPVTLCGELASNPLGALVLIALGFRSLSVAPSAIGPVKAMLLELDAGKAHKLLDSLIDSPAGSVPIRDRIKAFAEQNGLQL